MPRADSANHGAASDAADRSTPLFALLGLGAILLLALAPLGQLIVAERWPDTHEHLRYLLLFDHFRQAVTDGVLYPRWLPELYGGYGYPTFLLYQPGYFFAVLPFSFLTESPVAQAYLAIACLMLAGGLGAYCLCREVTGAVGSVFGAGLFLLTPYLYVDLFVRGDLSELMAVLLTPWPLFCLLRLKRAAGEANGRLLAPSLGLAVALALVVLAHPITALFLGAILGVSTLWYCADLPSDRRWVLLASAAAAALLAAAISGPYWVPFIQSARYVDLDAVASGYYAARDHLVYPHQLVRPFWGFGGSVAGDGDGMSFQLGLPHLLLALTGAALGWRRRAVRIAFVLYVACAVLMTTLAAPFWTLSLVGMVQFPWRLLSVIAVLQVVCASGLGDIWRLPTRGRGVIAGFLLVLAAWFHHIQFEPSARTFDGGRAALETRSATDRAAFEVYALKNEFLPKTAMGSKPAQPRPLSEMLTLRGVGAATSYPDSTPLFVHYRVVLTAPARAVVEQLYFPGWVVEVDGRDIAAETLRSATLPDGRLSFDLSAGIHEVRAFFDGPPYWRLRNIVLSLIGAAAVLGITALDRRTRHGARTSMAPATSRIDALPL
jgi:hypothetical protein